MQTLNLVVFASTDALMSRLLDALPGGGSDHAGLAVAANSVTYDTAAPQAPYADAPPAPAIGGSQRYPNASEFVLATRHYHIQHDTRPDRAVRALVAGVAGLDVAIFMVSGSEEVDLKTRTLAYLAGQLGVRQIFFGVDLVGLGATAGERYRDTEIACRELAEQCGLTESLTIPLFTDSGSNIADRCTTIPYYRGESLQELLQRVVLRHTSLQTMPLRVSIRGGVDTDGSGLTVSGTVLTGTLHAGDRVRVQPIGRELKVTGVSANSRDQHAGLPGDCVSITFSEKAAVDVGHVISSIDAPAQVADQFQATVVWTGDTPMFRGRTYDLRTASQNVRATVAPLKYQINPRTFEHVAAERLQCWEAGVCELELDRAIVFDPFVDNPSTGSFVLVDPITLEEVGAGILQFALRRSHNVHVHGLEVTRPMRASQKRQKPCILWLTGLSGSGKSTIANTIDKKLHAMGKHTYVLDGDNVRHGLTKDLGFTAEDRVENIRRIAEVAKLMVDAGLIVMTAFISPFRSERLMARNLMQAGEFIEVFVDTPLDVAEHRDPKGLYKKARRGELKNFTGLDSPYEAPEAPEIRLSTTNQSPDDAADAVIDYLRRAGILESI